MNRNYCLALVFALASCMAYQGVRLRPAHFPEPIMRLKHTKLNAKRAELGRILFYDPILSANNSISCASCHTSYNAFAHTDHRLSHGIHDSIGTRNAPALMNLAWQHSFMWDGAIQRLDAQALAPIESPVEMGSKLSEVLKKLQDSGYYPQLFYKAYKDSIVSTRHLLDALMQFQLRLISANAKYDSVQRSEAVFTEQEKKGYLLFKKNCNVCHTEPLFSNFSFQRNGLPLDHHLKDFGRFLTTAQPTDSLLFKVPSLRNLSYSYPYMHDGRFKTLYQVLGHYTKANLPNPILLTSEEKVNLIAFLLTLNDKHFIFDRNFSYPPYLLKNK